MNAVFVPVLPKAIYYMENYHRAPWHGLRGKTLFEILGECSTDNRCEYCQFRERCESLYDKIIDSDVVTNWRETIRHVTRYLK